MSDKKQSSPFKATISIDRELWDEFRFFAKQNHSDSSKELRKFVAEYTEKHRTLNALGKKVVT